MLYTGAALVGLIGALMSARIGAARLAGRYKRELQPESSPAHGLPAERAGEESMKIETMEKFVKAMKDIVPAIEKNGFVITGVSDNTNSSWERLAINILPKPESDSDQDRIMRGEGFLSNGLTFISHEVRTLLARQSNSAVVKQWGLGKLRLYASVICSAISTALARSHLFFFGKNFSFSVIYTSNQLYIWKL
jgi:hypothetical protein